MLEVGERKKTEKETRGLKSYLRVLLWLDVVLPFLYCSVAHNTDSQEVFWASS